MDRIYILYCPFCGQPFRYATDTQDMRQVHTCPKCLWQISFSVTVVGDTIDCVMAHAKQQDRSKVTAADKIARQSFADLEIRALAQHCARRQGE